MPITHVTQSAVADQGVAGEIGPSEWNEDHTIASGTILPAPTIADFTNAAHGHGDADGGGTLAASSITASGASVYRSTAQSITSATQTALSWDAELYDTDSYHEGVTTPSRLTVPAAGKYRITSKIEWAPSTTGLRNIYVFKNGSNVAESRMSAVLGTGGIAYGVMIAHEISLAASDYLEIKVYQDSGGPLDVNGGAVTSSCQISFIGS